MLLLAPSSGDASLIALEQSGLLQTLSIAPTGATRLSSVQVRGWRGAKPVGLRTTSMPGVFVVLAETSSGAEIDLLRRDSCGSVAVVRRAPTREWFSSLEAATGKDKFFMPQGWGEAGTFHVTKTFQVVWEHLPKTRKALADRTVVGLDTPLHPFWLSFLSMSDSTSFIGYELQNGRAVAITDTHNPISSITGVAAWRVGNGYAVLDNVGQVYRFEPKAVEGTPVSRVPKLGFLHMLATGPVPSLAIGVGMNRALLLQRTSPYEWRRLSECAVEMGRSTNDSMALISSNGRWGVLISKDGTAHLLEIVRGISIRFVRKVPKFTGPSTEHCGAITFL